MAETEVNLVDFLRARLDEDEAAAVGAAKAVSGGRWQPAAPAKDVDYVDYRAHVVRHDPARVLREVEAKRQILGLHARTKAIAGPGTLAEVELAALDVVARALAAVYSDHPDYRLEWA